jgi:hypothetical protein
MDAGRARLLAAGERHEQIGQLGVAVLGDEPPLDTARAGRTKVLSIMGLLGFPIAVPNDLAANERTRQYFCL